ncbi:MAG: OsmC family protein [Clostridia bacterium]
MFGTLAGALAARHVEFDRSRFTATVEGVIEGEGATIRITAITMHYRLAVPRSQHPEAERALKVHPGGCPAHESVKDSIQVTWEAEIDDL